jgi:hypothetical protein
MNELRDRTEVDAVINRHMARLLSELEDAGCPSIFREAVKSKLAWLRSDLNAMTDTKGRNERTHP